MNISGVFVFLLKSGLDLASSKLVAISRQDPFGSKVYGNKYKVLL